MILALDSSTSALALALGIPQGASVGWIAERSLGAAHGKHAAALPLAIGELLSSQGLTLSDLTACAGGLGPGSFTGLRVGLGTLKGLAYARQLPIAGTSSLRALALGALQAGAPSPVAAIVDARHGEVYVGLFEGPGAEPLGPELAVRPEQLPAALGDHRERATLIGEWVIAHASSLARSFGSLQLTADRFPAEVEARWVGELCLPIAPFALDRLFRLEPRYVRASEAEIKFPDGNFKPRAPVATLDP